MNSRIQDGWSGHARAETICPCTAAPLSMNSAPAAATSGASAVIRSDTPGTFALALRRPGLLVAEILQEAGFPPGVLNVVTHACPPH
jgi:acyl-CoA reductase-like NAD-dependent aldehyde dehydrogenase